MQRVRVNDNFLRSRLAFCVAAGVVVLVSGCGQENTYVAPPPPKVAVIQPLRETFTETLEFTGNTAATETVELRARVPGYLDKVLFRDGQQVKKGDLLFVIEQQPYELAVRQAQGELARAEAQRAETTATAQRVLQAAKSGAVSRQQADEAVARQQVAEAQVYALKAALDKAKVDLSYTEVRAPFDGRIERRLKDPGNLVGTGEDTVITSINRVDPIYVYFSINELDLLRILGDRPRHQAAREAQDRRTQPLFLALANEDDFPHQGIFDFAAITLDSATGTLLMRGLFPNSDNQILPGLFARIRAPIREIPDALLVPERALGVDQSGRYVLVVKADGEVEQRTVQVGGKRGDLRMIEKGLNADERIVVDGIQRARPGAKVDPIPLDQQAGGKSRGDKS